MPAGIEASLGRVQHIERLGKFPSKNSFENIRPRCRTSAGCIFDDGADL